jgi:hypothetical protein
MEYVEEKVSGLTLHLPTPWPQEDQNPQFLDNQDHNIYRNPGRSANRLHKQFTNKLGEDTLKHIQNAVHLGAQYHVHGGFKERNSAVAQESQYLVAFTWNNGKTPKEESGTYDTWKKHRGTKMHVPIGSLPCAGGREVLTSYFSSKKPQQLRTEESEDSIDSGCCSLSAQSMSSGSEESQSQTLESQAPDKKQNILIGLKRETESEASTARKRTKNVIIVS